MVFAPAVAWALVIHALGSIPNLQPPVDTRLPIDWVGHFTVFAVLGALIVYGVHRSRARAPLVLLIVAGVAVGVIDELHQRSVPGRYSTIGDLVADLLGCALGVWLGHRWLTKRAQRRTIDSDARRSMPDADAIQEHSA